MMIGKKIILSDVEQVICIKFAELVYKNNRKFSVADKKIGDQTAEETDLEGFAGELAFCKLFNVMPDFSLKVRSSDKGTDHGDAVVNGKTIDIKTTKYKTGRLLTPKHKKINCNYHALIVGQFPEYEFRGFIKTETLMQESNLKDLGYGLTYCVEQDKLVELESLEG